MADGGEQARWCAADAQPQLGASTSAPVSGADPGGQQRRAEQVWQRLVGLRCRMRKHDAPGDDRGDPDRAG